MKLFPSRHDPAEQRRRMQAREKATAAGMTCIIPTPSICSRSSLPVPLPCVSAPVTASTQRSWRAHTPCVPSSPSSLSSSYSPLSPRRSRSRRRLRAHRCCRRPPLRCSPIRLSLRCVRCCTSRPRLPPRRLLPRPTCTPSLIARCITATCRSSQPWAPTLSSSPLTPGTRRRLTLTSSPSACSTTSVWPCLSSPPSPSRPPPTT